ncbi:MAG TPA: hypothetical protein VD965_08595 [Burkholderiales bacterium]|nr:hypothetical protein [Burkholderiales bacterium]
MAAYAAASFAHHAHNAEFLADYPNMPGWLTPGAVYAIWAAQTAIGVLGCALLRGGWRSIGWPCIGLYGAFGLCGLAHYAVAPLHAHTATMHATIGLEVATGLLLFGAVAFCALKR